MPQSREEKAAYARQRNARPLYRTWQRMRERCNNPNKDNYASYGGKGVRVCERWALYANFIADMGDRPPNPVPFIGKGHYWTLDRIDPTGDYEPSNCRWATIAEQRSNRRR